MKEGFPTPFILQIKYQIQNALYVSIAIVHEFIMSSVSIQCDSTCHSSVGMDNILINILIMIIVIKFL